jgi:hypothetical protein
MAPERPPSDAKSLWRKQQPEDAAVTLDNIHDRAQKFQSQIRRRNLREYVAALIVIPVFGFYIWIFPGWMIKTGSALSIIATLFVMWQLHKRAAAQTLQANSGMALIDFHREELIRQRNALKSVAVWYLAPFIPGVLLIGLGRYFQFHVPGRTQAWDHQVIILASVIVVLISGAVWLLNAWAAERLQRKIDQLDNLRSSSPRNIVD